MPALARRPRLCARMVLCALVLAVGSSASAQSVLETFEGVSGWQVTSDSSGSGAVQRSTARAASGAASARVSTSTSGAQAAVRTSFSDAALSHTWTERPGTYRWQRARVYVPAATLAQLGSGGYLTLARYWASAQTGIGWSLRLRQGGALYVVGTRDSDAAQIEFNVYATMPGDQWVELEMGLHSQHGPGVKRAFAFVMNGQFHGWYHQGRMQSEVYDRASMGIVESSVPAALEVFVDDWGTAGAGAFPTGTDLRSTASLQEQDYRSVNGAQWQVDWTTWANQLRLASVHGLYSDTDRLQSGRNLDRMPDLTSGWAEIEIGWPKGTPPKTPTSYFGPMVGFRKEINREQNFEVIPVGRGGGQVDLVLEAWNGIGPVPLALWPMPTASVGGTQVPEPGDIIRARWEQVGASSLHVRASYYDASTQTWHADVIDVSVAIANISGINFADGFHTASSVTTDSPYYSIRRFKVGTLATYPSASVPLEPPRNLVVAAVAGDRVTLRWTEPASGPAPTGFLLTGGASPGDVLGSVPIDPADRLYTLALPAGVYYLRLHATLAGLLSAPSNEVQVFVNVPAPPSAPAGLVGMVNGSAVALAWRNTFAGGTPTGVALEVSGALSTTIPLGPAESFSFAAVPPGTYALAVKATNPFGASALSNVVTLTFPGSCSGAPAPPVDVLAWRAGRTLFATWEPASAGPAPTAYVLYVSGAFVGSVLTTGRELSGVVGPGTYGVRVAATNPCGDSATSAEQVVTVP